MQFHNTFLEISAEIGDKSLHLIVVDYNSTDSDVTKLLTSLTIKHTYVRQMGRFNKVKGLNIGARLVPSNEIVLMMDLHLRLPIFMFDQIRKVITLSNKER